jgi:hypothetical protein
MKTKSRYAKAKDNGVIFFFFFKVATSIEGSKPLCRQLVRKKIGINMAANNGDTLVEAVISAKRTSPD